MTSQFGSTKHSFFVLLGILPSSDPWDITVSLLLCSSATSCFASFDPLNVGPILGHLLPCLYTFVLGHLIHADGSRYLFPDGSLSDGDSQAVSISDSGLSVGIQTRMNPAFRRVLQDRRYPSLYLYKCSTAQSSKPETLVSF